MIIFGIITSIIIISICIIRHYRNKKYNKLYDPKDLFYSTYKSEYRNSDGIMITNEYMNSDGIMITNGNEITPNHIFENVYQN